MSISRIYALRSSKYMPKINATRKLSVELEIAVDRRPRMRRGETGANVVEHLFNKRWDHAGHSTG
ncbi:MAG: hypothetical protein ACK5O6_00340, partial [Betaproteobacteria bacterium]